MWHNMLKVAAATALFGLVHSALASRTAKKTAEKLLGTRNRNGLYRVVFIAQSAATFAVLVEYIRRLPSRELYQVTGSGAITMHAGQLAGAIAALSAAHQIGLSRVTGLENLCAWLKGDTVGSEPEAQGPALDEVGLQRAAGPFAWSRHPLNFAPIAILWLCPRMTTSLLAFNLAATAYLVLGSLHEEARLNEAYGDEYAKYQDSGVSFYLPTPRHSAKLAIESLLEQRQSTRL